MGRLEAHYLRIVRAAQSRPRTALAAGLLLALGAIGLGRIVGTGFMPDMDEGGFILDYWTPTGTSLSETDPQVGRIEKSSVPITVEAFTRRTGAELGFFATSPNQGDMTVLLKPSGQCVRLRGHWAAAAPDRERGPRGAGGARPDPPGPDR